MAREVITQTNGSQGAHSFGPKEVNKELPMGTKSAGRVKEREIRLSGDNANAWLEDDEGALAFLAGGYLIEVIAYTSTGIAAAGGVDMATVAAATGVLSGPALAGVLGSAAAGTWERAAIDLPIGALDLQLTVAAGLAAGEEAVLVYRYLDAPA